MSSVLTKRPGCPLTLGPVSSLLLTTLGRGLLFLKIRIPTAPLSTSFSFPLTFQMSFRLSPERSLMYLWVTAFISTNTEHSGCGILKRWFFSWWSKLTTYFKNNFDNFFSLEDKRKMLLFIWPWYFFLSSQKLCLITIRVEPFAFILWLRKIKGMEVKRWLECIITGVCVSCEMSELGLPGFTLRLQHLSAVWPWHEMT